MSKYPKRGEDCEYTEDCMWGVDGWCDRPADRKCVIAKMDTKKFESIWDAPLIQEFPEVLKA